MSIYMIRNIYRIYNNFLIIFRKYNFYIWHFITHWQYLGNEMAKNNEMVIFNKDNSNHIYTVYKLYIISVKQNFPNPISLNYPLRYILPLFQKLLDFFKFFLPIRSFFHFHNQIIQFFEFLRMALFQRQNHRFKPFKQIFIIGDGGGLVKSRNLILIFIYKLMLKNFKII